MKEIVDTTTASLHCLVGSYLESLVNRSNPRLLSLYLVMTESDIFFDSISFLVPEKWITDLLLCSWAGQERLVDGKRYSLFR
jgi:hypothetical protein